MIGQQEKINYFQNVPAADERKTATGEMLFLHFEVLKHFPNFHHYTRAGIPEQGRGTHPLDYTVLRPV